jgi:hypothetical protein
VRKWKLILRISKVASNFMRKNQGEEMEINFEDQ